MSDVIYKAETFGHDWAALDLPFPCEIHVYHEMSPHVTGAKRVLLIYSEPRDGMASNEWVRNNFTRFDLIITYDRTLSDLPNVRCMNFGGVFCDEAPSLKEFGVSFVFSTGNNLEKFRGYDVRRGVARNFGAHNIPGHMYLSSRRLSISPDLNAHIHEQSKEKNYQIKMLGDSKMEAFSSMFHVCVENSNDDYYFTEKIIDCFRTYTVPIYWGTSRVLEFFDPEGIIYFKDPAEISEIISKINLNDYWSRMDSIVRNWNLASQYVDLRASLKKVILEALPG